MTAMPVLRPARAEEGPDLSALALRSKAHWGYDEAFMSACVDELTVSERAIAQGRIRIADLDGRRCGFYWLREDAESGEVEMLFVEPDLMGRGIGRILWNDLETFAKDRGLRELWVDSDPEAEKFYARMGLVTRSRAPSGSIPGRTLPRMQKVLNSDRDV